MMRYKGYLGRVEFDEDARLLHGEVVGLRDVVTFQADSAAGIEKAFRESVDDYLAFCKARGEQPDKPFSGNFVVRVDSELHRRLNRIAQAEGKSLNSLVAEFLSREVARALPDIKKATSKKAKSLARTRPAPASVRRPARKRQRVGVAA